MDAMPQRFAPFFALVLLISWNVLLVVYRHHVTGKIGFVFFIWNLLLAIIPYLSSQAAVYFFQLKQKWLAIGLILFAILFLPNSPYIITDLFHLRQRAEMPFWYDTMLLFSMALSGLLFFYASLFNIQAVLAKWLGMLWAEVAVSMIAFLCAYGIYLGRYLRFNSWDVVSKPDNLFEEIAEHISNPGVNPRIVGFTLLYGAFLLVGYWVARLFIGERSDAADLKE